uniref:Integrator complex subunit 5 C-terminal domain-containing protein n=1 Tax=Ditylenchus dipsaci TaxID=166011 RepID=A0A915CWH0_9BILA
MKSTNQELSLKQCKHLGLKLIENFCSDGLTSGFGWNNWEWEREQLSSYIEISKKLEGTPFINNFLLILGDTKGGIWFALPLLRSRFVHLLSELEKAILKDAKVSVKNVDVISSVFSVFVAANFIPNTLLATFDIICSSTNHEVYVVFNVPLEAYSVEMAGERRCDACRTSIVRCSIAERGKRCSIREMVLLVGQRHISDAKISFAKLVNICYESENQ